MDKTVTRRGIYHNDGRVITTIFEEVEEVQHYRGSTARNNLQGTSPPVIPVIPAVIPQGSHYGSSHQSRPAPSHQSTRSIVHPDATHHPPPSSRHRVPRSQSSGSHRSSGHNPGDASRPGALIPYDNPDSIERWASGVTPGSTKTASLIGSNAQRNGSTSHRSDKSRTRDRRQDEGKSRRGSTHRDRGDDTGSRADGRSSRLDPDPNATRKGSSTRGPPSHISHNPSETQRR